MAVPGPLAVDWAPALIAFGGAVALLGDPLRAAAARWIRSWGALPPLERLLLDLYLGGAALYLLAALRIGAFTRLVVLALFAVGAVATIGRLLVRRAGLVSRAAQLLRALARPGPLIALLTAAGLYAIEVTVATAAATGNTLDSGLLTTYVAVLLQHGSLPLSFQPYASSMILYPQGTTVWLGAAQLSLGVPPARTSLLVTPLFLGLAPIGGFVAGRRILGTDAGGAAFAVTLGWLGPGTRALVGGSNDFAVAFPLVLLLIGFAVEWTRTVTPSWAEAAGFGLLAGYSAALNPVGVEWLLPAVLALLVVRGLRERLALTGVIARWGWTVAVGLVPVLPTLYVLGLGVHSPGYVPGAPAPGGPPPGVTWAQWAGSLDPFLFRPGDVQLSPVGAVRLELAVLLVLGVALLALVPRDSALGRYLAGMRRFAVAAAAAIALELLLLVASRAGVPGARAVAPLTSGAELSLWVFTVYALVAALPLALCLERVGQVRRAAPPEPALPRSTANGAGRRPPGRPAGLPVVALVAALVIVVPGVALTPTQLAPVLADLYHDFGNVSAADFALLACAGAHLSPGSRVLVAPGSVGWFLPGYARQIVLLYPFLPGWPNVNASYSLVVRELTNATLDPAGRSALSALGVDYIAVSQENSVLWPPFSPAPLLADPGHFSEVFGQADAYLFATAPGVPPLPCG